MTLRRSLATVVAAGNPAGGDHSLAYQSIVLNGVEALELDAGSWNSLPARRGLQADLYDSRAWLASWLAVANSEAARRIVVVATLEGDRPVALLPLVRSSFRTWEAAGQGFRPRFRPVVGAESPTAEPLALLASAALREGLRTLRLPSLPDRDPGTNLLLEALRGEGYRVSIREGATECLTMVTAGWEEHRAEFRRFHRNAREKGNKARRLGALTLDYYGPGGLPILDGFRLYREVHARSWKGTLAERTRKHREVLLRETDPLGWPRLFVLRLAEQPVAAHIWFRIGDLALSYSTAYDNRLRALSPGTVLQWQGQERIFSERVPRLLDFLPGRGAQKEELGRDRLPLMNVIATRRKIVAPFAARLKGVSRRARTLLQRRRPDSSPAEPRSREKGVGAEPTLVNPGESSKATNQITPSPTLLLYLAVAAGHATVKAMRARWEPEDTWWCVVDDSPVMIRVGGVESGAHPIREVVFEQGAAPSPEPVLARVSAALEGPVRILFPVGGAGDTTTATPVHNAPIPFPLSEIGASEGESGKGETRKE